MKTLNYAYKQQNRIQILKEINNIVIKVMIKVIQMIKCKSNKSKKNHNPNIIHHKNNQIHQNNLHKQNIRKKETKINKLNNIIKKPKR